MDGATCSHCTLPAKKSCRLLDKPSPYFLMNPTDQNLTTTQAELKAFILKVENELTDYDAYVARVTHVLSKERKAVESFLAGHKRLLITHVHACPPEIMLEIFFHSLDWDTCEARPSYTLLGPQTPIPWVLSAVCRRWRNILRDTPSYWASFNVGSQIHFLEDALHLSKKTPLYPILNLGDGDSAGSASYNQALVKHTSRWKTLHVSGSRDAFASLGQLGNLPILKSLSVSLVATRDPDDDDLLDPEEVMDVSAAMLPFADCPQLEELSISLAEGLYDSDIIFEISSLSYPWSNLSKLTVAFGRHIDAVVLPLLLVCTNLRALFADDLDVDESEDPATPLLVHSGITSIMIMNPRYLLFLTDYPALTHLSLEESYPGEILPFLSRSQYHITHIQIVPETGTGDWDLVLQLLPDVIHFTVRLRQWLHQPAWTSLSASLETRLPRLRTLVVEIGCNLLHLCEKWDIVSVVRCRWAARSLEMLEIYSKQGKDRSNPWLGQDMCAVSWRIGKSVAIKALLGFKAEGLEVNINDIPLSDRTALLYM